MPTLLLQMVAFLRMSATKILSERDGWGLIWLVGGLIAWFHVIGFQERKRLVQYT